MQLEELTKTQIILLTLLTSFVTSIATGITTVTLMDQAPPGVTQTINRVVERTVEVIVPEKTQGANATKTVIIREEDFVVDATKKNTPNLVVVSILAGEKATTLGAGFIISADGIVVTDKSLLEASENTDEKRVLAVSTSGGKNYLLTPLDIPHARLAFLKIEAPKKEGSNESEALSFTKPTFAKNEVLRIGQTAIALGYESSPSVLVGAISRLEMSVASSTQKTPSVVETVYTTLQKNTSYTGGPLLDTNTDVLGIVVEIKGSALVAVPAGDVVEALRVYREKLASSRESGGSQ